MPAMMDLPITGDDAGHVALGDVGVYHLLPAPSQHWQYASGYQEDQRDHLEQQEPLVQEHHAGAGDVSPKLRKT